MKKQINQFALIIWTMQIVLTFVGTRLPVLTGHLGLEKYLGRFFLVSCLILSGLLLLNRAYKSFSLIFFTLGLTAAHAWSHLYWPTLKPGIARVDFLLANEISANFSWDNVIVYLKSFTFIMLSAFAIPSAWRQSSNKLQKYVLSLIGAAIAVNVGVSFVQKFYSLNFLAFGSGSSVEASRPPALFEDSAAASLIFAALSGGVFLAALCSEGHRKWLVRAFIILLCSCVFIGARTSLFGGAFASLVAILIIFYSAFTKFQKKLFWSAVLVLVIDVFAWQFSALTYAYDDMQNRGVFNAAVAFLGQFDRVRTGHLGAMALAFFDHPWGGSGLGMFYANLFLYSPKLVSSDFFFFSDPPGSFYGMLISELGVAGVLCVVFVGAWWLRAARFIAKHRPVSVSYGVGFGVLTVVLLSFFWGTHLIFKSFASLCAIGLVLIQISDINDAVVGGRRFFKIMTAVILGGLTLTICYQATHIPRVPEFRWFERGVPQIAPSVPGDVPIATHGVKGRWIASGSEVLIDASEPLRFFVEMPSAVSSVDVAIKLYDAKARLTQTIVKAVDSKQPWQEVLISDANGAKCPTAINAENFCSAVITTNPTWSVAGAKLGVFWATEKYCKICK
jgi:hypothetical protein